MAVAFIGLLAVLTATPANAQQGAAPRLSPKRALTVGPAPGCAIPPSGPPAIRRDNAEARRLALAGQESALIGDQAAARDAFARAAVLNPGDERIAYDLARAHEELADSTRAISLAGPLTWTDLNAGPQSANPALLGDAVLARKDIRSSYHLAVVVDDAAQHISVVTRGDDLFASTHLHRLLQELLKLPVPLYRHHRLIRDDLGRRLAKRDGARSLQSLRQNGLSPADIRQLLDLH
jgi:hypothetical protein